MTGYVYAPESNTFHEVSQDRVSHAVWRQTCNEALVSRRSSSPRRVWVDRIEDVPAGLAPCWGCFGARNPRPWRETQEVSG